MMIIRFGDCLMLSNSRKMKGALEFTTHLQDFLAITKATNTEFKDTYEKLRGILVSSYPAKIKYRNFCLPRNKHAQGL